MHSNECGLRSARMAVQYAGMAIAFARARYLSRATGGCAVRSACYNARVAITDDRTGERYSFAHRDVPEHHAVLLPEGAGDRLADSAVLWNLAEAAERRRDAQVAREIVLALPANAGLTHDDRVALAESFARAHFVDRGLAVQIDVHAPHATREHAGGAEGTGSVVPGPDGSPAEERANHHAHLLITTRRVEGDWLAAKKARDLDPVVRTLGGRSAVTEGERWGELWRAHQDTYFAAQGLEIRVDALSAVPGQHVGPVRMRVPGSEAVERAEEIARENALAARDPDRVLEALTRGNASFTEKELDRHLAKHIHDTDEHLAVRGKVLGHAGVLALHDPETGRAVGRYTTEGVRAQERAALEDGAVVATGRHGALGPRAQGVGLSGRTLRDDQQAAYDHAVGARGLVLLEGRAGTGKSYTLGAIRDAHAAAGYAVVGVAPTNAVAQDLKADGFGRVSEDGGEAGPGAIREGRAATVHSELFRLKNGHASWDARTLVVVDEAAMLDARVMGELLAEARRSGAKVLLAGDDRQLASIERGGLFPELVARHGAAEIREVTRQRVDWQRQAARDLSEGWTYAAVAAFANHGALHWSGRQAAAQEALVARWSADTETDPQATRFVFAYTNREVDALNAALRSVRKARGELGDDVRLETRHGVADFAVGDRVQITETLRQARLWNGNAGVVTGMDAETGWITARLDGTEGERGREVRWQPAAFTGFRHGYAGTIYKGQGKTIDHTYLLHSAHWRQAASYVALTRQRASAVIFAATETATDLGHLVRQMSRGEVRSASIAWATREELAPALRPAAGQGEDAAPGARAETLRLTGPAAPRWLIAPRVGEDKADPGAGAAAVVADGAVRRERAALESYLAGAYRDPQTAKARLDELVATHGATSAARRIDNDPEQLGPLAGRRGLFAGSRVRQARAQAERVAQSIGPAVRRLGAAEAAAAQGFKTEIAARRAAEAVGVPRLSARAQAAAHALGAAGRAEDRARVWEGLQSDERTTDELTGFVRAVETRLGSDVIRVMDRRGAQAVETDTAQAWGMDRATLAEIGQVVQAVRDGERGAAEGQRLAEEVRLRQGPRLRS